MIPNFRRIHFNSPPIYDIVLFDEHSEQISKYVLKGLKYFTFKTRDIEIYISPKILISFISSLRFFRIKKIKGMRKTIVHIVQQLRHCYHLACISVIKPKIVITYIDDSQFFHWLSKNYSKAEFFAIQNGCRTNFTLNNLNAEDFYLQHYFCFGLYEVNLFKSYNYYVKNFYPIGSLRNGYYLFNKKNLTKIKYDICLLSGWHYTDENKKDRVSQIRRNTKEIMYTYLEKYISEYNLNTAILLKYTSANYTNGSTIVNNEVESLKKYFKKNIDFIKRHGDMSCYDIMDKSEIVVGFSSTTLRESFVWGKKILYCDFTETDLYSEYDSSILFTDKNYELFKKRLNKLRNEPHADYVNRTKEYSEHLMNNNPNYPPHTYIRKKIEEYL